MDTIFSYSRQNPAEIGRLLPWIKRELQALLFHTSRLAHVLTCIVDNLKVHNMRSTGFQEICRSHLEGLSDHFCYELENFAKTSYDIVGYDEAVSYAPFHGLFAF